MSNPRLTLLAAVMVALAAALLLRPLGGGEGPGAGSPAGAALRAELNAAAGVPESQRPDRVAAWVAAQADDEAIEAVTALGRATEASSAQYLSSLIDPTGPRDARPPVRRAAVAALGACGDGDAHGPLAQRVFLSDDSPQVRAQAAGLLGQWHVWDAMPDLVAALRDPSAEVRGQAGAAVRRIIGTDYHYRATDPLPKREAVVRRLEEDWPGYHEAHLNWAKVLEGRAR